MEGAGENFRRQNRMNALLEEARNDNAHQFVARHSSGLHATARNAFMTGSVVRFDGGGWLI